MNEGVEVWLARDENGDLCAYTCKPYRRKELFRLFRWESPYNGDFIRLKSELFPEVTFKNSPQKARLILEEDE